MNNFPNTSGNKSFDQLENSYEELRPIMVKECLNDYFNEIQEFTKEEHELHEEVAERVLGHVVKSAQGSFERKNQALIVLDLISCHRNFLRKGQIDGSTLFQTCNS